MNTECMYVLKNAKTTDEAKEFAIYLEDLAIKRQQEVYPTYISVVTEEFNVTSDYDGFNIPFKVKPKNIVVWAYGKDYCMDRLRPKGAKRAFPYALNPNNSFNDKMKDLYCVKRDRDCKFVGFVKCK